VKNILILDDSRTKWIHRVETSDERTIEEHSKAILAHTYSQSVLGK